MPGGFVQTTAFLDKLVKGVDAKFLQVFDENVDVYQSQLDRLFMMKTSTQYREHTKMKAGTGLLSKKNQGGSLSRTSQQMGYETEFIHDTYAGGVEVTMEEIQDRDWADKLDEFKDLARSARITMDKARAQVLNGAFVTTDEINGFKISRLNDAKPMCSTVHPLTSGGTASNASSTGVALNDTSLDVARQALINQVTDDGVPVAVTGRLVLIVPPALTKTAVQITQSALESSTANNAVNYYKGLGIDVMEVVWLGAAQGGSDTAWFLMVPEQAKLLFIERLAPMFDQDKDSETKNRKYDVLARWSVGFADWRFIWGSKGNLAAYSS